MKIKSLLTKLSIFGLVGAVLAGPTLVAPLTATAAGGKLGLGVTRLTEERVKTGDRMSYEFAVSCSTKSCDFTTVSFDELPDWVESAHLVKHGLPTSPSVDFNRGEGFLEVNLGSLPTGSYTFTLDVAAERGKTLDGLVFAPAATVNAAGSSAVSSSLPQSITVARQIVPEFDTFVHQIELSNPSRTKNKAVQIGERGTFFQPVMTLSGRKIWE